MGKMFGGGGKGNSASVDYQKQADAEARDREDKRQERLRAGQKSIDEIFGGAPVMGNRKVQKTRQTPNPVHSTMAAISGQSGGMQRVGGSGDQDYMAWVPDSPEPIKGVPAFNTETYEADEQYDTGQRSGGIGDEFYDKYKNAMLAYYEPEVQKQYEDAVKQTDYGFARAGQGQSGARVTEQAKLATDKDLNFGVVRSKADTATAGLKQRVDQEKASALNQLYATEDPEMAANQALSKVRTTMSETPELNPLGDVFKIAAVGGGNFANAYMNPYSQVINPNVKPNAFTVPG
jgi:hypothetical protein